MKILLGITGSVSAYKTPWLVRDLRRAGHDVRVVMTPSATQFVAPLALEATSTHPVVVDPYAPEIQEGGSWHVHLAHWADVIFIAPCSATTLARLATGLCDTALMTVVCSRPPSTPLLVAPAMDTDMWEQPAVQRNVAQLRADGVDVIPPVSGSLASGLTGTGRLPELDDLVALVAQHGPEHSVDLTTSQHVPTALHTITITAGPTHEPIDAVRSIVNHSTGTMGFALAEAARDRGMLVTLIAGPVHLPTPAGVHRIDVTTAKEMMQAVQQHQQADCIVMAAAVADFTPAEPFDGKLKKESMSSTPTIALRKTDDILAYLGSVKPEHQVLVGFALEYNNVIAYAEEKLQRKNADMIVANQAGAPNSGFGTSNNTITIVRRDGSPTSYPAMSKRACAEVILDAIVDAYARKGQN